MMSPAAAFETAKGLGAGAGPWVAIAVVISVLLRAWQPFHKMKLDREQSEVGRLTARVETLEAHIERLESKIEEERQRHANAEQITRHRLNGETQSLDALLLLLETNPDKVTEAISRIRDMRAKAALEIAAEKGAAAGARAAKGMVQ
jgi:outer membrane murein-binding lipoprotein Lpp